MEKITKETNDIELKDVIEAPRGEEEEEEKVTPVLDARLVKGMNGLAKAKRRALKRIEQNDTTKVIKDLKNKKPFKFKDANAKKLHLSESLFEDVDDNNYDRLYEEAKKFFEEKDIKLPRDIFNIILSYNHIPNPMDMNESLNEEVLNEVRFKDSSKLKKEIDKIKKIADKEGFEYFTQMPFTSFEGDTESIEAKYPEFFKLVKAFFKEMGILEPEQLEDPDALDIQWDTDIDQRDWDTLMGGAEIIFKRGWTQFEKVFSHAYNPIEYIDKPEEENEEDDLL